jgi:putative effector of murein hydrolase
MLIIFAISPHNKIKDLPRFINVIEIALIITISTIIICFATAAIREIDFKSMTEIFNNLIFPSATSLAIPLFFIVEYLLAKLDFFQSF